LASTRKRAFSRDIAICGSNGDKFSESLFDQAQKLKESIDIIWIRIGVENDSGMSELSCHGIRFLK
jgi:hypothetical protein